MKAPTQARARLLGVLQEQATQPNLRSHRFLIERYWKIPREYLKNSDDEESPKRRFCWNLAHSRIIKRFSWNCIIELHFGLSFALLNCWLSVHTQHSLRQQQIFRKFTLTRNKTSFTKCNMMGNSEGTAGLKAEPHEASVKLCFRESAPFLQLCRMENKLCECFGTSSLAVQPVNSSICTTLDDIPPLTFTK